MRGLAFAFETAAKVMREHMDNPEQARAEIESRRQHYFQEVFVTRAMGEPNLYVEQIHMGFKMASDALLMAQAMKQEAQKAEGKHE